MVLKGFYVRVGHEFVVRIPEAGVLERNGDGEKAFVQAVETAKMQVEIFKRYGGKFSSKLKVNPPVGATLFTVKI